MYFDNLAPFLCSNEKPYNKAILSYLIILGCWQKLQNTLKYIFINSMTYDNGLVVIYIILDKAS